MKAIWILSVLVAALFSIVARADDAILALDCSNGNTYAKHIWIDLNTGAVTDDYGIPAGVPVSPATITTTTIQYFSTWVNGITWHEFIDRTTGNMREWQSFPNGTNLNVHSAVCVKSSAPLPATKF